MKTLTLNSNDLFLRYGGMANVLVFKLKAQHSPLVKDDDWEYQYTVGNGNQYTYQSLEIFGCEIKGEDLKKLASDLHQSRLLVNREGYCYVESEIVVIPTTSTMPSFNNVDYYRLNDLFGWSEYKVTKSEVTTVWDRRDLKNGSTVLMISVDSGSKFVSGVVPNDTDDLKDYYEQRLVSIQVEMDETRRKLKEVAALQAGNVLGTTIVSSSQPTSSPVDTTDVSPPQPQSIPVQSSLPVSQPPPPPPPPPRSSRTGRYSFETEEASQIHRSCQKMKPGHFMFELSSYAELKKSLVEGKCDEFETPEFKVGDLKWVLSVYLNGNRNDNNSDGYISLYLKKCPDPSRRSVNIKLLIRFFIYNYIHTEYLTIQDLEVKEFDDQMNLEAGVAQAISIQDFEDRLNGFVVGSKCRFGVEVILVQSTPYTAAGLSLDDTLEHRFGICDFTSYSLLPKDRPTMSTNQFTIDIYSWKVQIYPNGRGTQEYNSLSVFLELVDKEKVSNGEHLFVDFELRLKDKRSVGPGGHYTKRRVAWFTETKYNHGFEDYIELTELTNTSVASFMLGDCVTIEVYFNKLYKLKDI